ncbi:unnamed protein product [Diamesa tonsa]
MMNSTTPIDKRADKEEKKKKLLVFKEFCNILKEMTHGNLSRKHFKLHQLISQIKLLEVNTVERLDECTKFIFEKAISEPNLATCYALMCNEISSAFVVDVKTTGNKTQKPTIKGCLINLCQLEFDKLKDRSFSKNKSLKEVKNEEDPTKKKALEQAFEENSKFSHRAVGTVQFIGELFNNNMLTSKIMVQCIDTLMDRSVYSEEALECLCKLLSTIGKQFEKKVGGKKENDLTPTFYALNNIANKMQLNNLQISLRIILMIQDVIDLRLNNWMPRCVDNNRKSGNGNNNYNRQQSAGSSSLQLGTSPQNLQNKSAGHNNDSDSVRSELTMKSDTLSHKQEKATKTHEGFLEIKNHLELFEKEKLTVAAAVEKPQICQIDEKLSMEIYVYGLDQHDKTRFNLMEEFLKKNNFDYVIKKTAPTKDLNDVPTKDLNDVQKHVKDMTKSESETESIIKFMHANYHSLKVDDFMKELTKKVLEQNDCLKEKM